MQFGCCLLSQAHRDVLEVLLCAFDLVLSFAEPTDERPRCNKMSIDNLATVIAPTLLFSSKMRPNKQQLDVAVSLVKTMINLREKMFLVQTNVTI